MYLRRAAACYSWRDCIQSYWQQTKLSSGNFDGLQGGCCNSLPIGIGSGVVGYAGRQEWGTVGALAHPPGSEQEHELQGCRGHGGSQHMSLILHDRCAAVVHMIMVQAANDRESAFR